MYLNFEDRQIKGVEGAVLFCLFFCLAIVNMFLRAASGTFAICLVIIPVLLFCPNWELTAWIRQHALSLLVGVFVVQLILPVSTNYSGVQLKINKSAFKGYP